MSAEPEGECRYFVTYSGIKLPLKLVNELDQASLQNRNTFYRGYFNDAKQLTCCQKVVYGEIESQHRYQYYSNGVLKTALIIDEDDEENLINFDEQGEMLRN